MIIDVHKYLIFGNRGEMDRFFYLAQRAGFLEFIGTAHKKALELPDEAKTLLSAIKIAKHHPIHPNEAPPFPHDPVKLAEKIVSLNADHEKFLEEERLLIAEIARISVFGDFSRSELDLLEKEAKRTFQFFCMKSDIAREISLPPEVIYVGTEYDLDYFVSVNRERTQYPKMIEILIDRPVGTLRERLLHVREELARLESDLRVFSNTLPSMQHGLIECLNEHHLELAKHDAAQPLNRSLFAIEAWVPETRVKALHGLLGSLNVECEEILVEKSDQIPTYMENKGVAKVGEDLVHVYDTPAHTDKDPSAWVIVFFSLFFALIISDAGYGLIFLLIALLLKWKFPRLEGAKKRFVKLLFILSGSCIVWGIATASYFGMEIGPENPLRKSSFIHYLAAKKAEYHLEEKDDVYREFAKEYPAVATAKDGHDFLLKAVKIEGGKEVFEALDDFYDNVLMEFSFLVGILHISLSFLRYLARNWSGLGWIVFMAGGYLFFPSIVEATTIFNYMGWISKGTAYSVGLQMVIAGIALAFFAALIRKKWGAFHELLNVVQVFADVLSYLRLYALALGGMVMAHTFNDHLGIDAGIVATILIIFLGHLNNIALCIMGGVIHGLRLNFLEWYHYSFDGGGRLFNPLRLRKAK
jgi:V/A-type H+-transporting ATPase subunit I